MNLRPYIFLVLLASLVIETTVITFPLVYITLLILYILYPDSLSVILGFIAGLVLDSLKLTPIGVSSIVIMTSFGLLELYSRFFELRDPKIAILGISISSFIFSKMFSYTADLLLYIFIFGIAGFLVVYFQKRTLW